MERWLHPGSNVRSIAGLYLRQTGPLLHYTQRGKIFQATLISVGLWYVSWVSTVGLLICMCRHNLRVHIGWIEKVIILQILTQYIAFVHSPSPPALLNKLFRKYPDFRFPTWCTQLDGYSGNASLYLADRALRLSRRPYARAQLTACWRLKV